MAIVSFPFRSSPSWLFPCVGFSQDQFMEESSHQLQSNSNRTASGLLDQLPPIVDRACDSRSKTDLSILLWLPLDVFERVLSFLPVLYVVRLRLVSKQWNKLLSSQEFLDRYVKEHAEEWIAVFDGLGSRERSLLFYDISTERWQRISFGFLPQQFDVAVAAAGGLICVASKAAERNVMCVCNPLTKVYQKLPGLQLELKQPLAIMERNVDGNVKIYVMSADAMAVFDSRKGFWLTLRIGGPVRPRSPVICEGAIYGLRDDGLQEWRSWKLVCADLVQLSATMNQLSQGADVETPAWNVLNQLEWGQIPARVRQPRLLGCKGCLLLVGGLKTSLQKYPCSTFIILRLDLGTLQWREVARMPTTLYWRFDDTSVVKIFGNSDNVFFLCKYPPFFVVCNNLSGGQVTWRRIVDCPEYDYCLSDLCKGFIFTPKLAPYFHR